MPSWTMKLAMLLRARARSRLQCSSVQSGWQRCRGVRLAHTMLWSAQQASPPASRNRSASGRPRRLAVAKRRAQTEVATVMRGREAALLPRSWRTPAAGMIPQKVAAAGQMQRPRCLAPGAIRSAARAVQAQGSAQQGKNRRQKLVPRWCSTATTTCTWVPAPRSALAPAQRRAAGTQRQRQSQQCLRTHKMLAKACPAQRARMHMASNSRRLIMWRPSEEVAALQRM